MGITELNWLDWSIIGLISLSMLVGALRGFVREALSLVVWLLAFWIAFTFSAAVSTHLVKHISNEHICYGLAFTGLFIATLLLGGLVNFMIAHLVHKTGLGGMDRILGLLFGFARGIIVIAVVVLLVVRLAPPATHQPWWEKSKMIPQFEWLENKIYSLFPKSITKHLQVDQSSNSNLPEGSSPDINAPSSPAPTEVRSTSSDDINTEPESIIPDKPVSTGEAGGDNTMEVIEAPDDATNKAGD